MRSNLYSVPRAEPIDSLDPSSGPDNHGKGRRCPESGCITILNSYTQGPFCLLHGDRRHAQEAREEVARIQAQYERERQVVALHQAGLKQAMIARITGISRRVIPRILRDHAELNLPVIYEDENRLPLHQRDLGEFLARAA